MTTTLVGSTQHERRFVAPLGRYQAEVRARNLPAPRSSGDEAAALAAVLFAQLHRLDRHAAVGRLAHVVDGEQADLHRGERLHLHPGAAKRFGLHGALDGARCLVEREVHRHPRQRQRMA